MNPVGRGERDVATVSNLICVNMQVRDYWASRFLTSNYKGSTDSLYTWNDMNEPSVFNGPEITMQKDLKHAGGTFQYVHPLLVKDDQGWSFQQS